MDTETLFYALLLTAIPLSSKLICSMISGKIFKFSLNEIGLLFGLSSAHAAVVIAIAMIGYHEGLIGTSIFNATVILVLISCITSSMVTEFFGKRVVLADAHLDVGKKDEIDRVIVPYANPNTVEQLLNIAVNITFPSQQALIYPLSVMQDDNEQYRKAININRAKIKEVANNYSKEVNFNPISRIDINPVSGINRAIKEIDASTLIIG